MDNFSDLRNTVYNYVASADEKLLRMIWALAESYRDEEKIEPIVPEWYYKKLFIDRENHQRRESESYKWEEVKTRLKVQYGL